MTTNDYLVFLQTLVGLIPFTVLDVVFLLCLIIYVVSEKHTGLVKSLIVLATTIVAWNTTLLVYRPISTGIQQGIGISKGAADGISILILVGVVGLVMAVGYRLLLLNIDQELWKKKIPILNSVLGGITFCIIASAVTTLLLSFPLTPFIKTVINESTMVSSLGIFSQTVESTTKKMLAIDSTSTVNFLTIDPSTNQKQTITHGMRYSLDTELHGQLITEINNVREEVGVPSVSGHEGATKVSQVLAQRMAQISLLSRTEVEGNTPFDVLSYAGVSYTQGYFMTAHAQSIKGAIHGFTQIPQYKTQLTNSEYTSVGVGVVSLEEYGYIVTMLFLR